MPRAQLPSILAASNVEVLHEEATRYADTYVSTGLHLLPNKNPDFMPP